MRRRRPNGYEGELKMADDLIDNLRLFDEGITHIWPPQEGQRSGSTSQTLRIIPAQPFDGTNDSSCSLIGG
jgi:hypothetical protein